MAPGIINTAPGLHNRLHGGTLHRKNNTEIPILGGGEHQPSSHHRHQTLNVCNIPDVTHPILRAVKFVQATFCPASLNTEVTDD